MEEPLRDSELERGTRKVTVEQDTTFTLVATNSFWPKEVKRTVFVKVLQPTSTPVPTPVIIRFDVDPLAILVGDTVRISWEVSGADSVNIEPIGNGLPLKGDVGDQPLASLLYRLTAIKIAEDGTEVKNGSYKEVIVSPQPTPTPIPVAPQIQLFEATPKEVVAGEGEVVRLTWSVSGDTTNIEITSPSLQLSGLKAQDSITVTVEETTLFVLTAFNGELKSSQATEVKAIEPTPTPTPTPIPTAPPPPTATPTPYPPPVIVYYKAEGNNPLEDQVVFVETLDEGGFPVYVYRVEGGSRMKLAWEVRNAESVVLQDFGPQALIEDGFLLPGSIIESGDYVLIAQNNGGANTTKATIRVDITSPEPPPPPYNVAGVEDAAGGTNTITWSYRFADRSKIVGFRIYRADFPPGSAFEPVQTLYDTNANNWVDSLAETCGKAYYVVALYVDYVTDEEVETQASTTSWYSQPCP